MFDSIVWGFRHFVLKAHTRTIRDNITIHELELIYTYSSLAVSRPKAIYLAPLSISVERVSHKLARREEVGITGYRYLLYYDAYV